MGRPHGSHVTVGWVVSCSQDEVKRRVAAEEQRILEKLKQMQELKEVHIIPM